MSCHVFTIVAASTLIVVLMLAAIAMTFHRKYLCDKKRWKDLAELSTPETSTSSNQPRPSFDKTVPQKYGNSVHLSLAPFANDTRRYELINTETYKKYLVELSIFNSTNKIQCVLVCAQADGTMLVMFRDSM